MKKVILLIAFAGTLPVFGQCKFKKIKWGLEAGMITSGMPEQRVIKSDYVADFSENRPVLSPLIGISGTYKFNRHFGMSLGMQYFRTGLRTSSEESGTSLTTDKWTYFQKSNLYFNHLSFPLMFNYTPFRCRLRPTLSLGVRSNYLVSGHYDHQEKMVSTDPESNSSTEGSYNVFKEYQVPPSRVDFQLLVGASVKLGPVQLLLNYSRGNQMRMAQYKPAGFCATGYYQNLSTNTLSMSLKFPLVTQFHYRCGKRVK